MKLVQKKGACYEQKTSTLEKNLLDTLITKADQNKNLTLVTKS